MLPKRYFTIRGERRVLPKLRQSLRAGCIDAQSEAGGGRRRHQKRFANDQGRKATAGEGEAHMGRQRRCRSAGVSCSLFGKHCKVSKTSCHFRVRTRGPAMPTLFIRKLSARSSPSLQPSRRIHLIFAWRRRRWDEAAPALRPSSYLLFKSKPPISSPRSPTAPSPPSSYLMRGNKAAPCQSNRLT